MLKGIPQILTGELLQYLDEMGHGDTVAVVDAHFPAATCGQRVVNAPSSSAPEMVTAIGQLVPFEAPPVLMTGPEFAQVQTDLLQAAGWVPTAAEMLSRTGFYDSARTAFVIVRTGEVRPYGNIILTKAVVPAPGVGK